MSKNYYCILKSDSTVNCYYINFQQIEKNFPALNQRLKDLLSEDTLDQQALDDFKDATQILVTYRGSANSSLRFQKKNNGALTENAMSQLHEIYNKANTLIKDFEFLLEQLENRRKIEALVAGANSTVCSTSVDLEQPADEESTITEEASTMETANHD